MLISVKENACPSFLAGIDKRINLLRMKTGDRRQIGQLQTSSKALNLLDPDALHRRMADPIRRTAKKEHHAAALISS
jgi:hypothetical protein